MARFLRYGIGMENMDRMLDYNRFPLKGISSDEDEVVMTGWFFAGDHSR